MSDINHQEFYEFFQQKVAENPQMSIEQAMSEFKQLGIKVTPIEVVEANMPQSQKDQLITAKIQQEQGAPVHL